MRRMGGGLSGGKKGNVGGFGVEGFWITREKVVFLGVVRERLGRKEVQGHFQFLFRNNLDISSTSYIWMSVFQLGHQFYKGVRRLTHTIQLSQAV